MKLSDETSCAPDWVELAPSAFHEPDAALDRLYEMACRDQWTVAGLDWSALDLTVFPLPFRQAAGAGAREGAEGREVAQACEVAQARERR